MSETESDYQSLVNSLTPYEQSVLLASSVARGVTVEGQIRNLLGWALAQVPSSRGSEFTYYADLLNLPSSRDFFAYCHKNYRQAFDRVTKHRLQNLEINFEHEIVSYQMPDS